MTRKDGSTFDLEATQDAAFNSGPTRRIVHADGSVSIMREESTANEARAVTKTAAVRREELEAAFAADEAKREELIREADEHQQQLADEALFEALVTETEPTPIVNAPSIVVEQPSIESTADDEYAPIEW